MNASLFYEHTYKAGSSGYYEKREHGTCDVWHDGKRYVYRKWSCVSIREFKAAIACAFSDDGKIAGRYPSYTIVE